MKHRIDELNKKLNIILEEMGIDSSAADAAIIDIDTNTNTNTNTIGPFAAGGGGLAGGDKDWTTTKSKTWEFPENVKITVEYDPSLINFNAGRQVLDFIHDTLDDIVEETIDYLEDWRRNG